MTWFTLIGSLVCVALSTAVACFALGVWFSTRKQRGMDIEEKLHASVHIRHPQPKIKSPHWSDPCPGTVTGQHEWLEVNAMSDDPEGYKRCTCVACAASLLRPTGETYLDTWRGLNG